MDGVHLISWDLIAAPFDSPVAAGHLLAARFIVDATLLHNFSEEFSRKSIFYGYSWIRVNLG